MLPGLPEPVNHEESVKKLKGSGRLSSFNVSDIMPISCFDQELVLNKKHDYQK